jgi:transglutaminase superfamily protein
MTGSAGDGTAPPVPLSLASKLWLLGRVWWAGLVVVVALRRHPLPEAVIVLGRPSARNPLPPALLSRAVSRGLRIGGRRPRCLIRSLVLYRLLRAQGDAAEIVIGLPHRPESPDAHAWVELAGQDVGPWPGRGQHVELARYPRSSASAS